MFDEGADDVDRLMRDIYRRDSQEQLQTMEFADRQTIETIQHYQEVFDEAAEDLDLPSVLWHPTDKVDAISEQCGLVIASGVEDNPVLLQTLWERMGRNPHGSLILAEWNEPDELVLAVLEQLNKHFRRAFYHRLTTTILQTDETEDICRQALCVSYISRDRN